MLSLTKGKRACEPKDTTTIQLKRDGAYICNVWTLKDTELTDDVMMALQHAVQVGIRFARREMAEATSGIRFGG